MSTSPGARCRAGWGVTGYRVHRFSTASFAPTDASLNFATPATACSYDDLKPARRHRARQGRRRRRREPESALVPKVSATIWWRCWCRPGSSRPTASRRRPALQAPTAPASATPERSPGDPLGDRTKRPGALSRRGQRPRHDCGLQQARPHHRRDARSLGGTARGPTGGRPSSRSAPAASRTALYAGTDTGRPGGFSTRRRAKRAGYSSAAAQHLDARSRHLR